VTQAPRSRSSVVTQGSYSGPIPMYISVTSRIVPDSTYWRSFES
jgi:hypothetical protein